MHKGTHGRLPARLQSGECNESLNHVVKVFRGPFVAGFYTQPPSQPVIDMSRGGKPVHWGELAPRPNKTY